MEDSWPRVDAIQWYEGMLVGPQHFQQYTYYWHSLLYRFITSLSPFFWGISQFSLDPVLLVGGKFRILELEGILPDGLYIKASATDAYPLEADLTSFADQIQKEGSVMIYLAVPKYRPDAPLTTGDFPRYLSIPGNPVIDENTGDNPIYIPRLIPNLTLIVGDVPPPRYNFLPLAQISIKNDAYVLSPFIPPLLKVTESSLLGSVIADILQRLRSKSAFLSENLQSSSLSTLDPSLEETYETLLKAISQNIPFLEALLSSNTAHPYDLYLGLLSLTGNLTTLKRGQISPVFTPYNHNTLFQTFDQVITFILNMINLIQENYITAPFTKEDRIFGLKLVPSWWANSYTISLKGSSTIGPRELNDWLQNSIIASQSLIKSVRDRRIIGANRQTIELDKDLSISPPEGGILASITNDPEFIKPDDVLCILNLNDTEDTRPLEITLYVKKTSPSHANSSS